MKKKLWAVHSWLGLYTGIFIAFLSITGALVVFKDEIDVLSNPHLFKVNPQNQRLNYNLLFDKAKSYTAQQDSTLQIAQLCFPQKKEDALLVIAYQEEVKNKQKGKERKENLIEKAINAQIYHLFINPYTGEVLGNRNYYKSLAFYLRNIHVRFYDGWIGRQATGIFGIALVISTILGFVIYGNFMKEAVFASIRTKNYRQLFADWHKLIGVLTLIFNLMIGITGAWLGMQTNYMKWFGIKDPSVKKFEQVIKPEEDLQMSFDIEKVLQRTQNEFSTLIPKYLAFSDDGERTVSVFGDVAGKAYEIERHKIVFDKQTLETKFKFDIHQSGAGAKLYMVQEALHFGNFGGFWVKFLYVFFGLTSGFLSVTGFYIYIKRNVKYFSKPAEVIIGAYAGVISLVYVLILLAHFAVGTGLTAIVFQAVLYLFFIALTFRYLIIKIRKNTKRVMLKNSYAKV
ncbi:MAG: PepSY domain-containing protein [Thermoflexibacter sp.]|jgi:uncharacterized iron-regulated membrane protein|nr:PepSY domain-containing protein [Thermoflexibacter sp.]